MANFSGGLYYMPLVAMFASVAHLPVVLLVWFGVAYPWKEKRSLLDWQFVKRRIILVLLPICIGLLILNFFIFSQYLSVNPEDAWRRLAEYWPAVLFAAGVSALGIYGAVYLSAKYLYFRGKLTKSNWMKYAIGFSFISGILACAAGYFSMLFG